MAFQLSKNVNINELDGCFIRPSWKNYMNRDELIAQLMQLPNTEVVFVKNVWSGLGACNYKMIAGGQVQWNGQSIIINVN